MRDKLRDIILCAGMFAGIVFIIIGSMTDSGDRINSLRQDNGDYVAYIDGIPISKELFLTFSDKKALSKEGRDAPLIHKEALDVFLGEQILLTRAIEQEIVFRDPRLRAALLDAMREFIVTEQPIQVPDDQALYTYYEQTQHEYVPPARYQVSTRIVPQNTETPDPLFSSSAGRFRPLGILKRSLGEEATVALPLMKVGDMKSFENEKGVFFIRLDGKREGNAPPFEVVRPRVEEAWFRAEEGRIFGEYLKSLIDRSRIEYVTGAYQ